MRQRSLDTLQAIHEASSKNQETPWKILTKRILMGDTPFICSSSPSLRGETPLSRGSFLPPFVPSLLKRVRAPTPTVKRLKGPLQAQVSPPLKPLAEASRPKQVLCVVYKTHNSIFPKPGCSPTPRGKTKRHTTRTAAPGTINWVVPFARTGTPGFLSLSPLHKKMWNPMVSAEQLHSTSGTQTPRVCERLGKKP
ncbi:hypothetical protein GWK47_026130 [Chionoecetes opilio]|uniref:Uncharacterized protein n=1 Tax=Chionoecetes opilio TaxID=41210 RepID=A0A8J8WMW7_CHIOP|nr:hypothetical protein GWK47_026130 [Chionoecetes opilio]